MCLQNDLFCVMFDAKLWLGATSSKNKACTWRCEEWCYACDNIDVCSMKLVTVAAVLVAVSTTLQQWSFIMVRGMWKCSVSLTACCEIVFCKTAISAAKLSFCLTCLFSKVAWGGLGHRKGIFETVWLTLIYVNGNGFVSLMDKM